MSTISTKRLGDTLSDWLEWQEHLHPLTIDMGLERVNAVRQKMALAPKCPVIMVAGTNGKGSVCALLSNIFYENGIKVGTYTSPHLLHYNERIMVNLKPASDESIVESFAAIEAARGDISLTYFEFGTLAAVHRFVTEAVDVMVLEVGLGGRLDAVNCFEPDVSIITNIDLDHQALLGHTREAIGREKAGIFRMGKPALYGQTHPPQSVMARANELNIDLKHYGQDFSYVHQDWQWSFHMGDVHRYALPIPALRGSYQLQNAALALAASECIKERLPLAQAAIKRGLIEVNWPGRFQILPGRPMVVLDVGHNPHAVKSMVDSLKRLPFAEKSYAVFSMLADKDLVEVLKLTRNCFDAWFVSGLNGPRGQNAAAIAKQMQTVAIQSVTCCDSVSEAWQKAVSQATERDRIVVFGSFFTVAGVLASRSGR